MHREFLRHVPALNLAMTAFAAVRSGPFSGTDFDRSEPSLGLQVSSDLVEIGVQQREVFVKDVVDVLVVDIVPVSV